MQEQASAIPRHPCEKKLWSDIQADNKQAFGSFFSLYYPRLFQFGYGIIPQEDFVKDCIQELFLKLWDKRKSIGKMYSVKSYLYVSMRRTLFNNIRKQNALINRNVRYMEEYFDESSAWEDPFVYVETKREFGVKLEKAILSLSNRKREVIYLKYYEELSNSEIASLMQIKPQSVYNHVSEAIIELKRQFKTDDL